MSTNESPLSVNEPGIGLMLIFSVIQFIIGNIIILLLETQPWTKINCTDQNNYKKMKNKFRIQSAINMTNLVK
jgi:hypothetical protein